MYFFMIALISDIHGNYTALKEVLQKIDLMGINEVYCLGDIVGYYSEVNECCEALQERGILSVMGNHDWYMVAKTFCPRSKSVNDCLAYQRTVITEQNVSWLSSLPVIMNVGKLSIVHGGWTNPLDEYLEPSEEYFSQVEGEYFASGHVHRQFLAIFENKVYCSVGSVGQPRDNDPRAAFATFDGQSFALYRVEYDIDRVGFLMEKCGFSGYYYGCLRVGAKRLQW